MPLCEAFFAVVCKRISLGQLELSCASKTIRSQLVDRLPTDNLERALIEIDLFRLNFRAKVKNIKSRDDVEPQLFAFFPSHCPMFFCPKFSLKLSKGVTLANSNWSPFTAIAHHIMSCHYSKIFAATELHFVLCTFL